MSALQVRPKEVAPGTYLQSNQFDFSGCRLRARVTALRADLIREVEARVLIPFAGATCPKPLRLFVPSAFPSAVDQAALSSAEDDAMVPASCVLTDRGEVLVADHSDDGLTAIRPRSLGFLMPDAVSSPSSGPSLQGQKQNRIPILLLVSRTALGRSYALAGGLGISADPLPSDTAVVELRLLAPSRNQHDALRSAIEGWNSEAKSLQTDSMPVGSSLADKEQNQSEEGGGVEAEGSVPADLQISKEEQESLPCSPGLSFVPQNLQPQFCTMSADGADSQHSCPSVVAIAPVEAVRDLDLPAYDYGNGSPTRKHFQLPDAASNASATQLQKRISAAREDLRHVITCASRVLQPQGLHPVGILLAETASATEEYLNSVLDSYAKSNAADFNSACEGEDGKVEPDLISNSDYQASECEKLLAAHMDLRAAAAGLLAGLDAALVLEISRFTAENSILRGRLFPLCVATSSCWKKEKINAGAPSAAAPITLSGEPKSPSYILVSDPCHFLSLTFFLCLTSSPHHLASPNQFSTLEKSLSLPLSLFS